MAKRKAFYLYKRKKKHGAYWYVCYINPDTGAQETAKSIDVLKERLDMGCGFSVKDRDSAAIIAGKALEAGLVFSSASSMSFNSYCKAFWEYETSEYVALRNRLKPDSIGREYCMNMLGNYRNHVEPVIPAHTRLGSVTVDMLDRVVSHALSCGMASGSVQMIVLSFSIPLKEAVRKRMIKSNPASCLMRIPRSERERGIMRHDEVVRLMERVDSRPGDRIAMAVKLSLTTGMRSGEVRALSVREIFLCDAVRDDGVAMARIVIEHSLAPYSGIKCPKNHKSRELYIDDEFARTLVSSASCDGVVFPGTRSTYMSSVELRLGFYALLADIGIDEKERAERNLTFHSLRHMFNTMLHDAELGAGERMLALGHSSRKVNERYVHDSERRLMKVSLVSSRILHLARPGAEKSAEEFQYFLPSEKTSADDSLSRYREQS